MRRLHPSPALVISLIALFVALGGTSYAAVTALPANSVGTAQLKNGAVTPAKLNSSVATVYHKYGGTLPTGKTEVGDWSFGTSADVTSGTNGRPGFSFPVPLAGAIAAGKAIYVTGASATHCPGAGKANAGYLCVYQKLLVNKTTTTSASIFNPETGATATASQRGFGLYLVAAGVGDWYAAGSYAVGAP